jgi:hypothetical protein
MFGTVRTLSNMKGKFEVLTRSKIGQESMQRVSSVTSYILVPFLHLIVSFYRPYRIQTSLMCLLRAMSFHPE